MKTKIIRPHVFLVLALSLVTISKHMKSRMNQNFISKLSGGPASSADVDTRARHTQTAIVPDSAVDPLHSAPRVRGTSITRRKFAPPPSVAPDTCVVSSARGVRLCAEYGKYSASAPPHVSQWVCHSLCRATNVACVSCGFAVAPRQWTRGSVEATDHHSHWQRQRRLPRVRRLRPSRGSFWSHFSHDPWGWDPPRPPKPGFAQHAIRSLPFPLHAFQLIALFDQARPEFLEEASLTPILKAAVDCTVIPIHTWNMIPLTARAQSEDDRIEYSPPIHARATGDRRWFQSPEHRLDPFPQVVGNFPQSGQRSLVFCHRSLLVENL